jgi:uncharacterized membrane protein YcaP (DUF421 family)
MTGMEARNIVVLLDFILLIAVTSLLIFIKWYFSTLSSNVRNRLQTHEIVLTIFVSLIVLMVITNDTLPLVNRSVFFLLAVGIYTGACWIILHNLRRKPLIYPKSFLIFHNGKFLKGAILQNKLSEEDIMRTLKMKGVVDLKDVDTVILEANGELSVIFKKKMNVPI